MKKYILAVILLVQLSLAHAQEQIVTLKQRFEGTWTLDTSKSSFNDNPVKMAYRRIVVSEAPAAVTIENMLLGKNGKDSTSTEVLRYDGTVSKIVLPYTGYGIDTRYRSISITNAGQQITLNERHEQNNNGNVRQVLLVETWTLSGGGRELIVHKVFDLGSRQTTIRAVYNRAE